MYLCKYFGLCQNNIDIDTDNTNIDLIYVLRFSSYKNEDIMSKQFAYSAIIYKSDIAIRSDCKIKENTYLISNYNDLFGLELGLELAIKSKIKKLIVKSPSLLIINILNDDLIIKSKKLLKVTNRIKKLEKRFDMITYELVSRTENFLLYERVKNKLS